MKTHMLLLLMLSLTLGGCFYGPGGDYGYRDGGQHDRGEQHHDRGESHGGWGR